VRLLLTFLLVATIGAGCTGRTTVERDPDGTTRVTHDTHAQHVDDAERIADGTPLERPSEPVATVSDPEVASIPPDVRDVWEGLIRALESADWRSARLRAIRLARLLVGLE